MKTLFLITMLVFLGCDQMYDEDFEKDAEEGRINNTSSESSYEAELLSTDSSIPDLEGSVAINLRDDTVSVDVRVAGIPQNLIQVHYSYLSTPCSQILENEINADLTTTRSYNITETTSREALEQDLLASGATTTEGDVDLEDKSFVIRAFPNFAGVPTPQGVTPLTIACGDLNLQEPDVDIGTTTGGTTTAGTLGGAVGGDIGGGVAGGVAGDIGGGVAGGVAGDIGGGFGAVGGTTGF